MIIGLLQSMVWSLPEVQRNVLMFLIQFLRDKYWNNPNIAKVRHTPSHGTHPRTAHTLARHTPSHGTHPRTAHTLARHTPSHGTHPRTAHTLARHTPSHGTHPRTGRTLAQDAPHTHTRRTHRLTPSTSLVLRLDLFFSVKENQTTKRSTRFVVR